MKGNINEFERLLKDLVESKVSVFTKVGLVSTYSVCLGKWFAVICYIISNLQTLGLLITCSFNILPVNDMPLTPIYNTFAKLTDPSQYLDFTGTSSFPVVILGIITFNSMMLLIDVLALIIKLKHRRKIPTKLIKIWNVNSFVQPMILYYPIQLFSLRGIQYAQNDQIVLEKNASVNTAFTVLGCFNILVMTLFSYWITAFCKPVIKTKDKLSSKNNCLRMCDIFQKALVPIMIVFGSNTTWVQIVIVLLNSGIAIWKEVWNYYYFPYYKIQILRLNTYMQAFHTSYSCLTLLVYILQQKQYQASFTFLHVAWLILLPFAMKANISIIDWLFKNGVLFHYVQNPYHICHKFEFYHYFRKGIIKTHDQARTIDEKYYTHLAWTQRIKEMKNIPKDVAGKELDEAIIQTQIQFLQSQVKLYPKSTFLKACLANYFLRLNDFYLLIYSLIEDISKSSMSPTMAVTNLMLKLELQKLLHRLYQHGSKDISNADQEQSQNKNINMLKYIQMNEMSETLKTKIQDQINHQTKFWKEFCGGEPDMLNLIKFAQEARSKKKRVKEFWKTFEPICGTFKPPYLLYGFYLTFANDDSNTGQIYLEKYFGLATKDRKILNNNELSDKTLFSPDNVLIEISGSKQKLGRILKLSNSFEKVFGTELRVALGRNVKLIMSPFFNTRHDQYLLRYYETGVSNFLNKTVPLAAMHADGYIFPGYIHIKINPIVENGISFVSLFRPDKSKKRVAFIKDSGVLDSCSKEFAEDMGLPDLKNNFYSFDIFAVCSEFKKINQAFNYMALKRMGIPPEDIEKKLLSLQENSQKQLLIPQADLTDRSLLSKREDRSPLLDIKSSARLTTAEQITDRKIFFTKEDVIDIFKTGNDHETLPTYPTEAFSSGSSLMNEEEIKAIVDQYSMGSKLTFFPKTKGLDFFGIKRTVNYKVHIFMHVKGIDIMKIISLEREDEAYDDSDEEDSSPQKPDSPKFVPFNKEIFKSQEIQEHEENFSEIAEIGLGAGLFGKNIDQIKFPNIHNKIHQIKGERNESNNDDKTMPGSENVIEPESPNFTPRDLSLFLTKRGSQKKETDFSLKANAVTKQADNPLVINRDQTMTFKQILAKQQTEGKVTAPIALLAAGTGKLLKQQKALKSIDFDWLDNAIHGLKARLARKTNPIQIAQSVTSSLSFKGAKIHNAVQSALEVNFSTQSMRIFKITFFIVMIVYLAFLETESIIIATSLATAENMANFLTTVGFRGFYIANSLVYGQLLTAVGQGYITFSGNLPFDFAYAGSLLKSGLPNLVKYQNELLSEINQMPSNIEEVFLQPSIPIYFRNESNQPQFWQNLSEAETFQLIMEKLESMVYLPTPTTTNINYTNPQSEFLIDNVLSAYTNTALNNYYYVAAQLIDITNQTSTLMLISTIVALSVIFSLAVMTIRTGFKVANEDSRFMNTLFKLTLDQGQSNLNFINKFLRTISGNLTDYEILEQLEDLDGPETNERINQRKINRKAHMTRLERRNLFLFFRILPTIFGMGAISTAWYLVAISNLNSMKLQCEQIAGSLKILTGLNVMTDDLVDIIANNDTVPYLYQDAVSYYSYGVNQLSSINQLIQTFEDTSGNLSPEYQSVFYNISCLEVNASKFTFSNAQIYDICLSYSQPLGYTGLVNVLSKFQAESNLWINDFESSPRTVSDLKQLFTQGNTEFSDLINLGQTLLGILQETSYDSFISEKDSVLQSSIALAVVAIPAVIIVTLLTWFFVIAKILYIEFERKKVMSLIPVRFLIENRFIKVYLTDVCGDLLEGIKKLIQLIMNNVSIFDFIPLLQYDQTSCQIIPFLYNYINYELIQIKDLRSIDVELLFQMYSCLQQRALQTGIYCQSVKVVYVQLGLKQIKMNSSSQEFPKYITTFDLLAQQESFGTCLATTRQLRFLRTPEECALNEETKELMIRTIRTIPKQKLSIKFLVEIDPSAPMGFGLYPPAGSSFEDIFEEIVVYNISSQIWPQQFTINRQALVYKGPEALIGCLQLSKIKWNSIQVIYISLSKMARKFMLL